MIEANASLINSLVSLDEYNCSSVYHVPEVHIHCTSLHAHSMLQYPVYANEVIYPTQPEFYVITVGKEAPFG
jgi:hypothetical protein